MFLFEWSCQTSSRLGSGTQIQFFSRAALVSGKVLVRVFALLVQHPSHEGSALKGTDSYTPRTALVDVNRFMLGPEAVRPWGLEASLRKMRIGTGRDEKGSGDYHSIKRRAQSQVESARWNFLGSIG
jgi:hypothetical protein